MKHSVTMASIVAILMASALGWSCRGEKAPADAPAVAAQASATELASQIQGAVAYEYNGGIYRTDIGQANAVCLAPEGTYPRWSPDGARLAFVVQRTITCMDADGRNAVTVAEADQPRAVAWYPDGQSILFTDGDEIKSAPVEGGASRTVVKGYDFRELDISVDACRLIATVMRPTRLRAFDLDAGKSRTLAKGCSASLSPDGARVTNNLRGHKRLALLSWDDGTELGVVAAPEGHKFDNQFWSNHPDWLASMTEGRDGDIFIHRISVDRAFRITALGGCDRPDLFVARVYAAER